MSEQELEQRPNVDLRVRAAQVVGVSFPQRTLELIVIPYETETLVPHPREARMITETIAAGAFRGIERRANRVRVNRDHQVERTVGRASAFHTSRQEGLVAEVRISRTPLGDETLQLADDGVLDASAGFAPIPPDGERWQTRNRCRIERAWLGHIALTPEPAYETARVLAVRNATQFPAPPPRNLELLELEKLRADLAAIDARYCR